MLTRNPDHRSSRLARMGRTLARLWHGAETKASRTGPLIALETYGSPVWSPRDYAAFAREGVMQNAVVYRCVRMISEAAASVPLVLYDGAAEVESHPLLDLISKPSPGHTATDLYESWYGFLLVAGNAYVEAVALGGSLRELHALRPDRMKVVPGPDGWPEAYEYSAGGRSVRFAGEAVAGVPPILHMRLFHPANDHYGLSPIEPAAVSIDIHNAASRWNKALLDNSARPSGALVYGAGGHLTGEQFERLKNELEQTYQGTRNAGRPLLLEGGLDWKAMSRAIWTSSRQSTPRRARSRWRSACRRCCSASLATTPIRTCRRRPARSGARPCCRSSDARRMRSSAGWRPPSAASCRSAPTSTASRRSPGSARRSGRGSRRRASSPGTRSAQPSATARPRMIIRRSALTPDYVRRKPDEASPSGFAPLSPTYSPAHGTTAWRTLTFTSPIPRGR